MLQSIISTGAALGGQFLGQHLANEANRKEAATNRQFQEQMSSTSHQRAVEDLKKAGLNPLLAANSGASTPTGAQGTVSNPAEGLASSALEVSKLGLMEKKQKAEIDNLHENNKLIKAQANESAMRTHVMSKDIPKADIINEVYKGGKNLWNKISGEYQNSAKQPSFDINKHPFSERARKHNNERNHRIMRERRP